MIFILNRSVLTSFLLLFCFNVEFAFTQNIKYITNNEGLSNSSTNVFYQDSHDVLWIGTWDGLNKYNGREFEVFKPSPNSPNQICNNIIRDIVEQRKGEVWIATDNGISHFNHSSKIFINYFDNIEHKVFRENSFYLAKNNRNQLFTAIYNIGFYFYDEELESFIPINGIDNLSFKKIFFDNQDKLWVLTEENELLKIELVQNQKKEFTVQRIIKDEPVAHISEVFYNKMTDNIWIQNSDGDLFTWNAKNEELSNTNINISKRVSSIAFTNDNCYIGTSEKLVKIDLKTKSNSTELLNIPIRSLYKGKQDFLWVGTEGRGIVMLQTKSKKFTSYSVSSTSDFTICPVRCIWENKNGDLYIGTKGSGLFSVSGKDNSVIKQFTTNEGLLINSVYTLSSTDKKDICWIGTDNQGIHYLDLHSEKIYKLEVPEDLSQISSYAIYVENDTMLWVSSHRTGLYKYIIDKQKHPYQLKSVENYFYDVNNQNSLSNNNVFCILPDDENHLWIGTRGGGLNYFNKKEGAFFSIRNSIDNPKSISDNDILSLYKSKNNTLWVGTSFGLNQLVTSDAKTETYDFVKFTESEGMPNNTIHGILEDKRGNIWTSTNYGIAKLNLKENRIISFHENDGLQNNEFSDGAFLESSLTANIYFGGISGYNKFNPLAISDDYFMPKLNFDAFFVNNYEVNIENYKKNGTVVLKNSESLFGFQFTPIDYSSGENCEISYFLTNQGSQWISMGSSRMIILNNLPFGNYVLKVKNSNANNIWSDSVYEIPIKVLPPWWLTWQAVFIYLLISMLAIYLIYKEVKNRYLLKRNLELIQLEAQKIEDIHEAKLTFFTNIAHEFSNSLTLIVSPVEQLLMHRNKDLIVKKYGGIIKSNAERMVLLINELMEFRKTETGHVELKIEWIEIPELVKYTTDFFLDKAEQKNIQISIQIEQPTMSWASDRNALEKILFNIISNAYKYTPENGYISINTNIINNQLVIEVKNSGKGIKEDEMKHVFDRYKILEAYENQLFKGEARNGIGLALSKSLVDSLQGIITVRSTLNDYTSFTIKLPVLEVIPKSDNINILQKGDFEMISIKDEKPYDQDSLDISIEKQKSFCGEKPSLLIIDDDRELKNILFDILNHKYFISFASNGLEGLDLLKSTYVDLIICDIIMPELSGIEFIAKIKENKSTAWIPVIILSSLTTMDNQLLGLREGADAYINKPFNSSYLELKIDKLLKKQVELKQYFNSHLASIENLKGKSVHKEDKEFIVRLSELIISNIASQNLTIELLSNELGISKMKLYRKLKEIENTTPTEFIRNMRLNEVEKQLIKTNSTIQEIMYECGFNNKAYFYEVFQKRFNLTPKEFRQKSKENLS